MIPPTLIKVHFKYPTHTSHIYIYIYARCWLVFCFVLHLKFGVCGASGQEKYFYGLSFWYTKNFHTIYSNVFIFLLVNFIFLFFGSFCFGICLCRSKVNLKQFSAQVKITTRRCVLMCEFLSSLNLLHREMYKNTTTSIFIFRTMRDVCSIHRS